MSTDAGPRGVVREAAERSAEIGLLHVDDDREFVELAAEFLERAEEPLAVTTETDPEVAVERLTGPPDDFDCVLADYDMPRMTGLELLEELRARGCDLPFVLFTGKGNEEIASRAISAGVTDYIQKGRGTDQYAVVANQVTEAVARRRAEAALERRERHYRRLVESAPTPITMYDGDGRYVYANRAAATFFGAESPEELVGATKFDMVSPTEHACLEERLGRLREGESIPAAEHAYRGLDGGRRTGVASCAPAVMHEGAVGVSIIRDTSDPGGAAGPLDELASVLAHDIEAPLSVVEGRIDLARETDDLSHLDDAEDALDGVRTVVDDVVGVLRQEGVTVDPEPLDLADLAREAWCHLDTDDATLRVADAPTVEADEAATTRLLENLLRNAVEHGGDAPAVRVGACEGGFFVADDGPGIPPERREAVFDPGDTDGEGSGLGLVSVRQVARAHDWTVECTDSEAGGARFEVTGAAVVD